MLRILGPSTDKPAPRLGAHLRRSGAVLLTTGTFPGAQQRFTITHSAWSGISQGHGQLTERRVTVRSTGRGTAARPRTAELLLPDEAGGVAVREILAGAYTVPESSLTVAAI